MEPVVAGGTPRGEAAASNPGGGTSEPGMWGSACDKMNRSNRDGVK